MHIADGILSTPAMAVTNVGAAAAVAGSLSRIDYEQVPRVGVLAAVFFMASFIHVNLGPSSVHLLLNGFLGLLLGWASLPALAVALFLQWMLLGYGGITSLGANILVMGTPAVIVGTLFSRLCREARNRKQAGLWGAAAGGLSVVLTCLFFAALLHISSPEAFASAIKVILLAHVPIAVVEAVVLGASAAFLFQVRPDLLNRPRRAGRRKVAVAALALVVLGIPAQAHKVKCFASVEGDKVVGYAWAGGGNRIEGVPFKVYGSDDTLLHEGVTGKDGIFSFAPTQRCDHRIVVEAGEGHSGTFTVSASELPGTGATTLPVHDRSPQADPSDTPDSPETSPEISSPELRQWISQAMSREIAPLRRDLAELKEKNDVRDLLAGIGIIAGITGVTLYLLARKQAASRHSANG